MGHIQPVSHFHSTSMSSVNKSSNMNHSALKFKTSFESKVLDFPHQWPPAGAAVPSHQHPGKKKTNTEFLVFYGLLRIYLLQSGTNNMLNVWNTTHSSKGLQLPVSGWKWEEIHSRHTHNQRLLFSHWKTNKNIFNKIGTFRNGAVKSSFVISYK